MRLRWLRWILVGFLWMMSNKDPLCMTSVTIIMFPGVVQAPIKRSKFGSRVVFGKSSQLNKNSNHPLIFTPKRRKNLHFSDKFFFFDWIWKALKQQFLDRDLFSQVGTKNDTSKLPLAELFGWVYFDLSGIDFPLVVADELASFNRRIETDFREKNDELSKE